MKANELMVGDYILPIKFFNAITPNPDYDPENFDESIDGKPDSYVSFDELDESSLFRIIHYKIDTKAEKWLENHSKICPLKYWPGIFAAACINWTDGTRNYYSEEYVDKIIDFCEEYGGVIDFC